MIAGGHIVLRTLGGFVIDRPHPGRGAGRWPWCPRCRWRWPSCRSTCGPSGWWTGCSTAPARPPTASWPEIAALSRGTPAPTRRTWPGWPRRWAAGWAPSPAGSPCCAPGCGTGSTRWAEPGLSAKPGIETPMVEVAVQHGTERIGTIAVDRGAVAGLHGQRQHLLEDVADSLGVVFQASRSGIELERQLRAALAYAGGIAVSRRAVVAEMDWERRRIERDLHDGAQHHLVSLRLALGLVEHQVSTAQLEQARSRLAQIADQIEVAEEILAETAKGVSVTAAGRARAGPGVAQGAGWRAATGRRWTPRRGRTAADPGRRRGRGLLLLPGGGQQRPQARSRRGHRGPAGDRGRSAAVHRARRGSGLGHHGRPRVRRAGAAQRRGPGHRGGRSGGDPFGARRRYHRRGLGSGAGARAGAAGRGGRTRLTGRGGRADEQQRVVAGPGARRPAGGAGAVPRQPPGGRAARAGRTGR